MTELFWIDGPWPGRLAVSARPRGGDWLEDEIEAWRQAGIEVAVSLLTEAEMADLGLNLEPELCAVNGIVFRSLAIEDRSVPSNMRLTERMLGEIGAKLSQGKNTVVHCRQGVGRAGMITAALLVESGLSPADAVKRVSEARGLTVPETEEQRAWINSLIAEHRPSR